MAIVTERTDLDNILSNVINLSAKMPIPFNTSTVFTRPSNITPYGAYDVMNNAIAKLHVIDIGSTNGIKGAVDIEIENIEIISSNPTGGIAPHIYFFNVDDLVGIDLNDNVQFAPNYNDFIGKYSNFINTFATFYTFGNSCIYAKSDFKKYIKSDINTKIYFALISSTAYTPLSAETFKIQVQGKILL
jgi:hypothetical protein